MNLVALSDLEIAAALAVSPFGYSRYWHEKIAMTDSDTEIPLAGPKYLYVDGGIVDERPREQWNRLGRTIWNPAHIRRTAVGVAEVLDILGASGFVVKHKGNPQCWFTAEHIAESRAVAKMAFLRQHGADVDLTKWVGGFLLEGGPLPFIEQFLDYSRLFHRWPVEMVCRNLPLMLGLDYDLFVYWVSSDRPLLNQVARELVRRSILLGPSPYLPDPGGRDAKR